MSAPARWEADGSWLVEIVDECTCEPVYGAHEQHCGAEPLVQLGADNVAENLARDHNELVDRIAELEAAALPAVELGDPDGDGQVYVDSVVGLRVDTTGRDGVDVYIGSSIVEVSAVALRGYAAELVAVARLVDAGGAQ